jgi:hypothetical protein
MLSFHQLPAIDLVFDFLVDVSNQLTVKIPLEKFALAFQAYSDIPVGEFSIP